MMRTNGLILALAVLVPAAVSAQKKPGSSMHTRSAENYLQIAAKEVVEADKQKYFQQALEVTQTGAKSDPDNARVWLLMGQAQLGLGNTAAADSAFDKAEQLWPEYKEELGPYRQNAWVAAYNRGITLLQQGDMQGAVKSLEEADQIFRGRPEALLTLAQIKVNQNDLKGAEADLRGALAILRGPAPEGLKPEDAAQWAKDEVDAAEQLADLLMHQEQYDAAAAVYRETLQRQPDNVIAKANLGVALTRAGKNAEAAPLFTELLAAPNVDANTLFNVGVGLFRAEQWEPAIRAFERAAQMTPNGHGTLYNLGQSYYALTADLEKAKEGKPAAEVAKLNEQLLGYYTKMGETAQQILALDPLNANVLMMLAHSQRGRGEVAADAAKKEEWKKAVLATLERHEALPFTITNIKVTPTTGKTMVSGQVMTLKAAEGSPLALDFMLLDEKGATVATQTITVTAPIKGEPALFNVEIPSGDNVASWKYVVK